MKNDMIEWDDPALARWLGTITRDSTKKTYKSGFRRYAQYTGLTATQMIDEALEDQRKDPREKTDIVKQRLIAFYNWLVTEAPRRKRVKGGETAVVGTGLSSKIGHTYVNSVRSLYGTFDVYVKLKGRSRLPKARVINKRMIVDNMDVKRLVDHATSPRDRAMILVLFQGGMDVSTLCDLKYKDVAEGLERGDHPLKLEPYRLKTGIENFCFLGKDACEALNAYINDAKSKGLKFSYDTPLFLKGSIKALKGEGVKPNLVQAMMRKLAVKTGLVDEDEMKARSFNPLGPHALRESFGSIMVGKGVPDSVVDFWLGHEVGEMAEAYKRAKYEDIRQRYLEKEIFISIHTGGQLEETLRAEFNADKQDLQNLVNGLSAENIEFRGDIRKLEKTHAQTNEALVARLKGTNEEIERNKTRWENVVKILEHHEKVINRNAQIRVIKDELILEHGTEALFMALKEQGLDPETWTEIEPLPIEQRRGPPKARDILKKIK